MAGTEDCQIHTRVENRTGEIENAEVDPDENNGRDTGPGVAGVTVGINTTRIAKGRMSNVLSTAQND